jgi:hypothetical protein
MHALKVSLRDGEDCESNTWMAEDAFGYPPAERSVEEDLGSILEAASDLLEQGDTYKNILIVDDINDSGATISWIKNDWQRSCLPNHKNWLDQIWGVNVKFAVLTNNLASQETVNYSVWEVNKAEEDCWLVYPWEEFWLK